MCFTGGVAETETTEVNTSEYGLAELAARSGVAPRTIRFYQSQGLLPKPRRKGRDALYDDEHRERLQLVAELQDRGLTLGAIRDLLAQHNKAALSVADWLGLDQTLRGPWSHDRPRVYDEEQLRALLGDRGPGLLAALERARYLERAGDGSTWLASSPGLLEMALRLHDAGIDVELSARGRDLLRRRLARCADDLVELFAARAGAGFGGRGTLDDVGTALEALRPVARDSAGLIFSQEIERALRRLVDAGPTAVVGRSKRRRRD
jgi:DNA-binding transcriptional MerR regulator